MQKAPFLATFALMASSCETSPGKAAIPSPCSTLRCAADRLGLSVGTDLYLPDPYYVDPASGATTRMGRITSTNFNVGWIDLNWKTIEPSRGAYDWSYPDAQVAWAEEHGIEPWGHALIYNLGQDTTMELTPDWLIADMNDPDKVREHFERRITTVMERYRGRITHWIVLNEAYNSTYHTDNWYELLGAYAAFVFGIARATDPSAVLIYNEANNENAEGRYSANRASTDAIVQELAPMGLLDMLAFQVHIDATDELNVADFVAYMSAQQVSVIISELDFNLDMYPGTSEERHAYQAQKVAEIVQAGMSVPVAGIFFWDVGDANSWLGPNAEATLWDENLAAKPAYYSVLDVFLNAL